MASRPVTRDDVNNLKLLNFLVTSLFLPNFHAAVKIARRRTTNGNFEYCAMVIGYPVMIISQASFQETVFVPMQVANSRSEVLLKLLEAVENYDAARFPAS